MSGLAYYNEIDPYAAEWLRNLIAAGLITPGDVDTRSIVDVRPSDLEGYERCHFFAGLGVWDYALGLAAWPAGRQVWTGSCPCQPYSAAGKRGRVSDERHLWPAFFHLIEMVRPPVVLGEQVASKDGLDWLDLVQADLEGAHYDVGAVDFCAAGAGVEWEGSQQHEWLQRAILDCPDPILVGELRDFAEWACGALREGPPHIRQRLWFVAYSEEFGRGQGGSDIGGLAAGDRSQRQPAGSVSGRADRRLAHADGRHASAEGLQRSGQHGLVQANGRALPDGRASAHHGGGRAPDWLRCQDERWRPVEAGTFPLADGNPARMGRLRAYGNAINAEAAAAFIGAVIDTLSPTPGGLAEGGR